MRGLFIVMMALSLLLSVAITAEAQFDYDPLEDIGPDGTPVTSRMLEGVTVTITPQGGMPLTARTYNADTLVAFNGGDNQRNRPLNPRNVSGTRFISNVGDGINFANAQPIMFEFDQPISFFGLTTLDLLEEGDFGAEIKLQAFDQADILIDEHSRSGPQGPSGLDLEWWVSSGNRDIVKVLLTGTLAGGFSGYGIDDLILSVDMSNRMPRARNDTYLYLDFFRSSAQVLPVLENDFDPDGDAIRIYTVFEPGNGGTIVSYSDSTITYSIDRPTETGSSQDFITYILTDDQGPIETHGSAASVTINFCICPLECLQVFTPPSSGRTSTGRAHKKFNTTADDSLDVDLFRRFRDGTLLPTETGTRFVDLYYRTAPEVIPLLLFARPDLGLQAFTTLDMMEAPLHNLIVGDGSMPVTQTLIDEVSAFLDSFTAAVSDSLRNSLNVELARLGSLQDLVGLSVSEAFDNAFGDSITTSIQNDRIVPDQFILEQNFPNPFNSSTLIKYSVRHATQIKLVIYNILGQKIRTLVDEMQTAGDKSVIWDGTDGAGRRVPSGLYFYRLSVDTFEHSKEMLLAR